MLQQKLGVNNRIQEAHTYQSINTIQYSFYISFSAQGVRNRIQEANTYQEKHRFQ
jgi:hypothetical protein